MREKKKWLTAAVELVIVFLVTAFVFVWGRDTALTTRGYDANGGEYALLLIPFLCCAGKWIIFDWINELRVFYNEQQL